MQGPLPDYLVMRDKMYNLVKCSYHLNKRRMSKGIMYMTRTTVHDGLISAILTFQLVCGSIRSFGAAHETYISWDEAMEVLYKRAYESDILELLKSQASTPLPPPPASSTPVSSLNAAEPQPGPAVAAPVAQSSRPTPSTGILQRKLFFETLGQLSGPPGTPRTVSNPLESAVSKGKKRAYPGADTPVIRPSGSESALGLPSSSALGGDFPEVDSQDEDRTVVPEDRPAKRQRAQAPSPTVNSNGGASSKDWAIKRGISYRAILADYCHETRIALPEMTFQPEVIASGATTRKVYRVVARVGAMKFELPKLCDSTDVGEEKLSKIILKSLDVCFVKEGA